MALANFFDKSALAAAHAVRGVSYGDYVIIVRQQDVGVALPLAVATSFQGKILAELTVNLLARLLPRFSVEIEAEADRAFAEWLVANAHAINPQIEIVIGKAQGAVIVIGESSGRGERNLFVGSDGWTALFSPDRPRHLGTQPVPFGAAAAACFAVANIFRIIFTAHLEGGGVDAEFSLSLHSYEREGQATLEPDVLDHDIGVVHLVGLGAIGNGAAWTLARCTSLRGTLHLIDHEHVELTNLQRYVLTSQADVTKSKVVIAKAAFDGTRLTVETHEARWGEFLKTVPSFKLDTVVVAVDSADDRIAVQAALPRRVLNAWTQRENLGVSRHQFAGDGPCLCCLYLPDVATKGEDELVAEALRVPHHARAIRDLLWLQMPPPPQLLAEIAAANNVPLEDLTAFAQMPMRQFYLRTVCGGSLFRLSPNATADNAAVPMPFQSALAGVMLAAEIVRTETETAALPPITRVDLLHPLGTYLHEPAVKHASGRCICQDPVYVQAHVSKWTRPPAPLRSGG